ncbi:hypothetical protein SLE2022_289630 [Rubroshorea leprosula]
MGGNGKHRWKISFYHRSGSSPRRQQPEQQPPEEFLCPISGSLMSDPVVVQSGQTFERGCVQVCLDLGFTPALSDGSVPDFSALIPNLAIKSAILSWCRTAGTDNPQPPEYDSVERIVRGKMGEKARELGPDIRVSERELLKAVAENPPVIFSHAATEVGPRVNHFNSSSSSDESVIVAASPYTPLPLARRPACLSSGSSPSSGDIADSEILTQNPNSQSSSPEEQELFLKLKSNDVYEQEQAVISLRKITRTKEEARVSLCTPRILGTLRPLILSRYSVAQTNAIASLVNLSLEKPNKVVIVRSGFVPLLIDVLKAGSSEAQEHAAGALFSLALEDENKMAIGVLGALQPLLHALRSDSERTRHDSALALYHLSLTQSNRVKLVKLGAISTLLSLVKTPDMASRVLLVLCNLAASNEGKSAMLDANAVEILVGLLREENVDSEATRENCVAALFALSHGSMRFKGLAKEARAADVLREVEERGSERARDKARRILQMMKGREEEDINWEAALDSGGVSRPHYRVGKDVFGANSTNF